MMLMALIWLVAAQSPSTPPPAAPPMTPGTYRFETSERRGNRPLCAESWTLRADGTMTVLSGEEVVEKRWRLVHDRDGDWLVQAAVSTNGRPDCMGNAVTAPATVEVRNYLVRFNDGVIQVCPPPAHAADGAPIVAGCYATLRRQP